MLGERHAVPRGKKARSDGNRGGTTAKGGGGNEEEKVTVINEGGAKVTFKGEVFYNRVQVR